MKNKLEDEKKKILRKLDELVNSYKTKEETKEEGKEEVEEKETIKTLINVVNEDGIGINIEEFKTIINNKEKEIEEEEKELRTDGDDNKKKQKEAFTMIDEMEKESLNNILNTIDIDSDTFLKIKFNFTVEEKIKLIKYICDLEIKKMKKKYNDTFSNDDEKKDSGELEELEKLENSIKNTQEKDKIMEKIKSLIKEFVILKKKLDEAPKEENPKEENPKEEEEVKNNNNNNNNNKKLITTNDDAESEKTDDGVKAV